MFFLFSHSDNFIHEYPEFGSFLLHTTLSPSPFSPIEPPFANKPFPNLMTFFSFFFHPQSLIRVAGMNVSGGCLLEHGQLFSCSITEENDSLCSTRVNSSESLSEGHTLCLCSKSSEGSEKGALDWGFYSQGWTFHFANRKSVLQWPSI